ncbi:E3 binding domain-containing protein [Mesorhizobium sp. BAC0120]|uniref:E3 binding domain-containing protein n=1 Tax=Mesorhizobium sp. BAC0120 TaxID=3090670 RepID=UPI00298C22D1|nr:E3 binding domain-containing protein [Mesorhizobium sp. BAC0120]MDW6024013.1 E3 binding domain-containing protein [Mesorhizobium sp. BAC0120]
MTAPSAALPAALAPRIVATPYARRLARERGVPLSAISGSGPNGRITGDDIAVYRPEAKTTEPAEIRSAVVQPQSSERLASATAPVPAAIVVSVEFGAAEALLARIAEVRAEVAREDICLKAAGFLLQALPSPEPKDTVILLAGDQRRFLTGLADASLSAIAAMRSGTQDEGPAGLAISFVGKPGIRPVAARLIDSAPARLVVGAPDKHGTADCLLTYDPARISDQDAESCLANFRDLVEAPFRLLV